ncbi:hypothetical protein J6TS1_50100 [Siminovitchia terrae]|uniref:Uncharacterized protein n=1 Tax=Siminovitchia terrae TaxID=1914933 RepID=A0ABQ4L4L2_SIMTE|nr:hypothetical protein [Siminovitchia terrae]GIN99140.1 hypothetical protein J6TS1_50100 [Siminovitchia terrae]
MPKYISIFFLTVLISVILFLIFAPVMMGEGDAGEQAAYTVGMIIIVLLSFLIAQMYYVINLIKRK